jgi:hypothetical protein
MKALRVGAQVQWKWLGGVIDGRVERVYLKPVSRTIKGKTVKRNGSAAKPAYLVKSSQGNLALKLSSELLARRAVRRKTAKPLPEAFTEHDVTRDLSEDFMDAWLKLRELASSLGEQRIYASEKAIMFSRRICYMFVRPKKSYLEFVFFLPEPQNSSLIARVDERSPRKFSHTVRLVHADQVEEPLTDWIRLAFANCV